MQSDLTCLVDVLYSLAKVNRLCFLVIFLNSCLNVVVLGLCASLIIKIKKSYLRTSSKGCVEAQFE